MSRNRLKSILKNNSGVTLVETLMAFLIVCIAIAMLSSCIILAVSTISKGREATEITQDTIKKFWTSSEPDEQKEIEFGFYDNKGNKGKFTVNVNRYDINDISVYEFVNPTVPEETDSFDGE